MYSEHASIWAFVRRDVAHLVSNVELTTIGSAPRADEGEEAAPRLPPKTKKSTSTDGDEEQSGGGRGASSGSGKSSSRFRGFGSKLRKAKGAVASRVSSTLSSATQSHSRSEVAGVAVTFCVGGWSRIGIVASNDKKVPISMEMRNGQLLVIFYCCFYLLLVNFCLHQ